MRKEVTFTITIDEVVGLVLEFLEGKQLDEYTDMQITRIQDKYDIGEVTEEEKIQFLNEIKGALPISSYHYELVSKFLDEVREL